MTQGSAGPEAISSSTATGLLRRFAARNDLVAYRPFRPFRLFRPFGYGTGFRSAMFASANAITSASSSMTLAIGFPAPWPALVSIRM